MCVGPSVREMKDLLRELPSIDRLLHHTKSEALLARFSREHVTRQCREVLDELRNAIRSDGLSDTAVLEEGAIVDRLQRRLEDGHAAGLQRVVNATGTVLHTNLGRAPLADAAIDA